MELLHLLKETCFSGSFAAYSWFIIFVFTGSLLLLAIGTFKIYSSLGRANAFLQNFKIEGEASKKVNFEKLNSFLRSNNDLSHAWNEFRECIVCEREVAVLNGEETVNLVYKNSRPAEEFFQFDEIIHNSDNWFKGIKFGFFDSVPNILTGLGILGTFYGIISGLPSAQAFQSNSDEMLKSISFFVEGMKIAFGTSLLGLSFGLFFNFIEKIIHDILDQKINTLASRIDFLFLRKTEQDYLYHIMKQMEILTDAMIDMPSKMSNGIAEGFANIGIEKDEVTANIKEGVKEGFSKLSDTVTNLVEKQNEVNDISERIVQELRQIDGSISQTSQLIKESHVSTNGITDKLSILDNSLQKLSSELVPQIQKSVEANKVIQDSVTSLSESVRIGQAANETLRKDFNEVSSKISGINQEFVETYNNFQSLMTLSIKSNLEGFDKELGASVSRLANIVSDFGEIGEEILGIHESLNKKFNGGEHPPAPLK